MVSIIVIAGIFLFGKTSLPVKSSTEKLEIPSSELNFSTYIDSTIAALQGWWADALETEPLGSLYWTFQRSKTTQATLNGVVESFENSTQWLINDGVVKEINIVAAFSANDRLILKATIVRPDGTDTTFTWDFAWEKFN